MAYNWTERGGNIDLTHVARLIDAGCIVDNQEPKQKFMPAIRDDTCGVAATWLRLFGPGIYRDDIGHGELINHACGSLGLEDE